MQLLRLRASDSEELDLRRKEHYLHPETLDEILQLISNEVLSDILLGIRDIADGDLPKVLHFSGIVDSIQDVSGDEQQSICVRLVDDDFIVH